MPPWGTAKHGWNCGWQHLLVWSHSWGWGGKKSKKKTQNKHDREWGRSWSSGTWFTSTAGPLAPKSFVWLAWPEQPLYAFCVQTLTYAYIHARAHTHTRQSLHTPTTLTLPQQVLGKYFQSALFRGSRVCTMRFCLGRSHLDQKGLNIIAESLGMTWLTKGGTKKYYDIYEVSLKKKSSMTSIINGTGCWGRVCLWREPGGHPSLLHMDKGDPGNNLVKDSWPSDLHPTGRRTRAPERTRKWRPGRGEAIAPSVSHGCARVGLPLGDWASRKKLWTATHLSLTWQQGP